MRGSAAFRASVTPGGGLAGPWTRNPLWSRARAVPSLDLRFADNKSLTDATTGQNLVTFTRASSGTYVDSTGTIRTATTNLLLRSEEFNDAGWSKTNVSATQNLIAAPNGTVAADLITENTSNALHRISGSGSVIAGNTYTTSVYAKNAGRFLYFNCNALHAARATFDLQAGTVATVGAGSAAIVAVSDGWYRCSVTGTAASTVTDAFYLQLNDTNVASDRTYTGNGTSGIYLWGAQLEQSSTVGEYIPTTSTINSAPRFDHNSTTGESLGLLAEEQRTNLLAYSEEFDNAYWTKTNSSVTQNVIAAPNGTITADLAIATGAADSINRAVTVESGAIVAFSLHMKRSNMDWVRLTFLNGANEVRAWFNLATGVVGTVNTAGTGTSASASIQELGDGWYRCTLIGAIPGVTSYTLFSATAAADASFTRVTDGERYLWGAQLEAGALPTSYIPTTTAAATRSADVASITGSNFSSWYRQDEGTFFAEASKLVASNGAIFEGSDGSTFRGFTLSTASWDAVVGTRLDWINRTATLADGAPYFGGAVSATALGRIAATLTATQTVLARNGVIATGPAGSTQRMPVNSLFIGGRIGSSFMHNGTIKRLTYWPARLPNTTLQQITQ